ncbi:MAG: RraA family protein [Oscillospiraceae bacterium]|nr:RraA family protein [Oscillospiraceae bacterium]
MTETEILNELKKFDTPSITNVVATYPADKEICLGLYEPWEIDWYTDETLRCLYPEMGRVAGYAVTCVFGVPSPGFKRLSFNDVLLAVGKSPKPAVLAIKNNFPEKYRKKFAVSGGNMTTAMKMAGVAGVISDAPVRDIGELRELEVQYLVTGVVAGHGDFAVQAVNVPVNVAGMDICPGEIIHMDENGAVKFPREHLPDVLARVKKLAAIENIRMDRLKKSADIGQIVKILSGVEEK